jgi:hypothetical protein
LTVNEYTSNSSWKNELDTTNASIGSGPRLVTETPNVMVSPVSSPVFGSAVSETDTSDGSGISPQKT